MTQSHTLHSALAALTALADVATAQIREEDGEDRLACVTLSELQGFTASVNEHLRLADCAAAGADEADRG